MQDLSFALPSSTGAQYVPAPSFPNGVIVQVAKMIEPREDMHGGLWLVEATLDGGSDPAFSSVAEMGAPKDGEHRRNLMQLPPCAKVRFTCLNPPNINGQPASTSVALLKIL